MSAPDRQTDAAIQRLEERIAWLQKHVTEQDKVVLALTDDFERLKKECVALRERQEQAEGAMHQGDSLPRDEKPPHY